MSFRVPCIPIANTYRSNRLLMQANVCTYLYVGRYVLIVSSGIPVPPVRPPPLILRARVSAGLPRDHPESYHYYMWNEFFKHVDIEPGNAHVLDGNAPDLVAECRRFEDLIAQAGGVHLFIGGDRTGLYLYV